MYYPSLATFAIGYRELKRLYHHIICRHYVVTIVHISHVPRCIETLRRIVAFSFEGMSEEEVQDMLLSVEIDKRGEIDYKGIPFVLSSETIFSVC